MSHLAAAARMNAGLAPTKMVSYATGVAPTRYSINLMNDDDNDDNEVCVEDVLDIEDDNKAHENKTQEPVISENYGRGIRIRKRPELYDPSMSGQL